MGNTGPGRPPHQDQASDPGFFRIQELRFDITDQMSRRTANDLYNQPAGRQCARMKGLLLKGYQDHLAVINRPLPPVPSGPRQRQGKRTARIGKFGFNRDDPLERDAFNFLRMSASRAGSLRVRIAALIVRGWKAERREAAAREGKAP